MCAEVSRGHAVRRRRRHCVLTDGRPCEDDDRHCDRFQSGRTHSVRKENGDNAAAHTQPGAPDLTVRRRSNGPEVLQTMQFLYLGGLIDTNADIMPDIKRQIRLAWACYDRFKCELYDMEDAPFTGKVRLLKTEVMETLMYGCVTWTLGSEHSAKLRTAHHNLLLRVIGFQRRQRTDHRMSYAKALKKAQCESVETTIRKRHLLFAGAVQRTANERLTHRVMFGSMAGGVNPGRGRPEKNWAQCLVDDIRVYEATEGSTDSSPLLLGVETVQWPRATKKSGKLAPGDR